MTFKTVAAACVSAAVLLGGCSETSKGSDGLNPAPAGTSTVAGAGQAIRDASLAKMKTCDKMSDYLIAGARALWDQRLASYAAAVSAGRATFVRSQADACIAALDAVTCAEWYARSGTGACAPWLAGAVAIGGTCYAPLECTDGWCDESGGCPGVCTAFRAHGASCTTGSWAALHLDSKECGPGYTCRNGSTSANCVADTLGALGQPCGTAGCQAGLYCAAGGTCEHQMPAGEPCRTGPSACEAGLTCDLFTRSVCEPLAGGGESCTNAACGPGFYCSANGSICKAQALAGQDCSESGSRLDAVGCVDGSFCLGGEVRTCTYGTAAIGTQCEAAPTPDTPPSSICNPDTYCITPPLGPSACAAKPSQPVRACYE